MNGDQKSSKPDDAAAPKKKRVSGIAQKRRTRPLAWIDHPKDGETVPPDFAAHGCACQGLTIRVVLIDETDINDPPNSYSGEQRMGTPRWVFWFQNVSPTNPQSKPTTYRLEVQNAAGKVTLNYRVGIKVQKPGVKGGVFNMTCPVDEGSLSASNPVAYGTSTSNTPVSAEATGTDPQLPPQTGQTLQGPPATQNWVVQFPPLSPGLYDVLAFDQDCDSDTASDVSVTAPAPVPPPPPAGP